jgi:hypothetical protein
MLHASMSRWLFVAVFACTGIAACGADSQIDLLPKSNAASSGGTSGGSGGSGGSVCAGGCAPGMHCDTSNGRCVQCLVALDCPNAKACDPAGNCADPCTATGGECTSSSKPVCDPGTGACVECVSSKDCHEDPLCIQGHCGECTSNAECAGTGKPFCSPNHECRQCLVNSDCPPPQTCEPNELHCSGGGL